MPVLTSTVGSMPAPQPTVFRWSADDIALNDAVLQSGSDEAKFTMASQAEECIYLQDELGLDILVDGGLFQNEINPELHSSSYIYYFARFNRGVECGMNEQPRIVGRLDQVDCAPMVQDYLLASQATDKPVKISLPGPSTFLRRMWDEFYGPERPHALATDYCMALTRQMDALHQAGCRHFNIDDPHISWNNDLWGIRMLDMAISDFSESAMIILHMCRGKAHALTNQKQAPEGYFYPTLRDLNDSQFDYVSIEGVPEDLRALQGFRGGVMLGVVDQHLEALEPVEDVVADTRRLIDVLGHDRIILSPNCGLKRLPIELLQRKLSILTAAAGILNSGWA